MKLKKLFYKIKKYIFPKDIESTFTDIYKNNLWESEESASGIGSTLEQTERIRIEIPNIIKELKIKSILDIPCGDFNWMRYLKLNVKRYIGADIVKDLIKKNKKYEDNKISFIHLNLIEDKLPKVDLVLCRDCLFHFSNKDIFLALKNLKESKSNYLLTTTFTNFEKNKDIFTGSWRELNLEKSPFNFPKPIKIINEGYFKDKYADKSLALWKLEDIHIKQYLNAFNRKKSTQLCCDWVFHGDCKKCQPQKSTKL